MLLRNCIFSYLPTLNTIRFRLDLRDFPFPELAGGLNRVGIRVISKTTHKLVATAQLPAQGFLPQSEGHDLEDQAAAVHVDGFAALHLGKQATREICFGSVLNK